jgi:hypothetical protein
MNDTSVEDRCRGVLIGLARQRVLIAGPGRGHLEGRNAIARTPGASAEARMAEAVGALSGTRATPPRGPSSHRAGASRWMGQAAGRRSRPWRLGGPPRDETEADCSQALACLPVGKFLMASSPPRRVRASVDTLYFSTLLTEILRQMRRNRYPIMRLRQNGPVREPVLLRPRAWGDARRPTPARGRSRWGGLHADCGRQECPRTRPDRSRGPIPPPRAAARQSFAASSMYCRVESRPAPDACPSRPPGVHVVRFLSRVALHPL